MEELNIETLTCYEAGKLIHKNAEFIRAGLRQKTIPCGSAVQSKSGQWNYIIFKKQFLEWVGELSK